MIEGGNLLNANLSQVVFNKNSYEFILNQHLELGLTFGWLYGSKPMVLTADVRLIKAMVLDRPNGNINRIELNLTANELEKSIMLVKDEQWRRCRRTIAPALKSHQIKTANVVEAVERSLGKLIEAIEFRFQRQEEGQRILLDVEDLMGRFTLDTTYSSLFKQNDLVDFNAPEDELSKLHGSIR